MQMKMSIAENILKNDKHTMLEGYIVEDVFEQQYLKRQEYTRNWWFAQVNERKYFFIIKESLNQLDKEIMSHLPYECWQVVYKNNEWEFISESERLSEAEFINQKQLRIERPPLNVSGYLRDVKRQEACIEYFTKRGIAVEVATERLFANRFLTVYFQIMTNIDGFIKRSDGQIVVTEIKFKYESKDDCFGFNIGQANLLNFMKAHGFFVKPYILYNTAKSTKISILDFLKMPGKKYWLTIEGPLELEKIAIAPNHTSLSGRKTQKYYKVNKTKFCKGFPCDVQIAA